MQQVTTHNPDSMGLDEQILKQCVHQALNIPPRVYLTALLLAMLLVIGLWRAASHVWLLIWYATLFTCYAARVWLWKQYHAQPEQERVATYWNKQVQWSAGIAGVVWGMTGMLPTDHAHSVQFLVGFVLTGVCAGAVPGLSSLPRAAAAFILGCILPFAFHALRNADTDNVLMALMSLLFVGAMLVTIKSTYARVEQGIRQQLQLIQRDAELLRNEQLRTAVNESLRRTQAQLQHFINYAPAAVAMFNCKLRYLSHSNRWLADYGLNLSDNEVLLGRSYFEIMPDLTGIMKDAFEQTLAGEVQSNDGYPFIRNDGTVRWFRWEMRPWYEDTGPMGGVVMFSEDITDTKRAHDALQARERLLDKLGVQVPGVMFQGRWRSGDGFRFTYVSANAASVCGFTAVQLCADQQLYLQLFDASSQQRLRDAAQQAAMRAGNIHLQLRIQVPKKGLRWVQIDVIAERLADASVLWYGYVEDVTLRHQMALQLAKFNIIDDGGVASSAA